MLYQMYPFIRESKCSMQLKCYIKDRVYIVHYIFCTYMYKRWYMYICIKDTNIGTDDYILWSEKNITKLIPFLCWILRQVNKENLIIMTQHFTSISRVWFRNMSTDSSVWDDLGILRETDRDNVSEQNIPYIRSEN